MPSFVDVHSGDPMLATNVQQVIDALKGTPARGVPLAVTAVNDAVNYAETIQNLEATNSRALNVLKSDGSVLIRADVNGVQLGAPITLPAGSLNGTQLADGTVANAKLGPDVARANLLTNGGFEVWQRGNGPFSVTGSTALPVTADRWWSQLILGAGTVVVTRETSVVDVGSLASAKVVYTAGAGDATACSFQQQVSSAADLVPVIRGRTVSFSVRAQTSAAGRIRPFFYDGVTSGGARIFGSYNTLSGTWETLSFTFTVAPTATAFFVGVDILLGSTTTFYLDNACLVVGSQPANYVPLHPADELARCLRYYETMLQPTAGEWVTHGQCYSTSAANFTWRYRVQKPLVPTLTVTAPATFNLQPAAGGSVACSVTASSTSMNSAALTATGASGMAAGNATLLIGSATSQIAAESNP
jgi:hypothetical protein